MATGLSPASRTLGGRDPRRVVAGALVGACLAVALAGCATGSRAPTYPPEGSTPIPATGQTDGTRAAVVAALAAAGLEATDADQPYRPPEGPWFAAAPRSILEVQLPNDGPPLFIVLYAFDSPADAATAAADQATYVSHGAGQVYFPGDSRFTIQTLGATAIFFVWSPANDDPRTMAIETALDAVGSTVTIPR